MSMMPMPLAPMFSPRIHMTNRDDLVPDLVSRGNDEQPAAAARRGTAAFGVTER